MNGRGKPRPSPDLLEQLGDAVADSTAGILLLDRDWRCSYLNDAAVRLLGRPRKEMLGQDVRTAFPDGRADPLRPRLEIVQSGGETARLEYHHAVDDAWFELHVAPSDQGMSIMFVDVTERKLETLRYRGQAALLDHASDAIIVCDLEQHVRYWNQGAERIYGWTADEIRGRDLREFIRDESEIEQQALHAVREHGEWAGELRHSTKAGREIDIYGRWTLIRDDDGRPRQMLAIHSDITERKIVERQFLRAQRMESIGTLAGGVAHDLNNVLAPIIMGIDYLRLGIQDPEQIETLESMREAAQRGADMIRQVLSFARGVDGQRVLLQMRHLLKDLEKLIRETFPRNIELSVDVDPELWLLTGDPTQLHQTLLNLCINARDAMPRGGHLTISSENVTLDEQYAGLDLEARPGPYVLLRVTDDGEGIPATIRDRIFEPFFTTKEVGQGTGLGLSTVLAIVRSHGGFVRIYSEPGNGTTCKVYLPADRRGSPEPAEDSNDTLPRGHGETVLVIDDEPSVQQITRQTLEAFGYRVLLAGDGAEGLSLFVQHRDRIDAVLTDMMMPVMDGPATIGALRRIDPDLPIIAASGLSANGKAARAASAGVNYFLSKPYSAAGLLQTLKRALAEKRTARTDEADPREQPETD